MTDLEIRTAILADATLRAFALAGNDEELSRRLGTVNKRVVATIVTDLTVIAAFATPSAGETCLQKLETIALTNGPVKRALEKLKREGLNVGHPLIRAMLDQFAAAGTAGFTLAEAATIKAMAEQPDPVPRSQVNASLAPWRPDGRCGKYMTMPAKA